MAEHIITRVCLSSRGVETVDLDGGEEARGWRVVSLKGWLDPPGSGVQLSERESGDGAHDVPASDIRYSSRTVSVGFRLVSPLADVSGRSAVLGMLDRLRKMVHRIVRVEVLDSTSDLYCDGYLAQMDVRTDQRSSQGQSVSGTVDVVCVRPELLSVAAQSVSLGASPIAAVDGEGVGLRYSPAPGKSGAKGLAYPLRYAEKGVPTMSTTGALTNHGTSRAYPVFVCNGPLPHGVRLVFGGERGELICTQPVSEVPLVLDCRSRTAEVGGLDVSRTLVSRGFPTVGPGESLVCTLSADGTGWVDARLHDTWM